MQQVSAQVKPQVISPKPAAGAKALGSPAGVAGLVAAEQLVYFCEKCNMPMLRFEAGWMIHLGLDQQPLFREKLIGTKVAVRSCSNCNYTNFWRSREAMPQDTYQAMREAANANQNWRGFPPGMRQFPVPKVTASGRGLAVRLVAPLFSLRMVRRSTLTRCYRKVVDRPPELCYYNKQTEQAATYGSLLCRNNQPNN